MSFRWLSALFTLSLLILVTWALWEAWGWVPAKGLAPRALAVPTALLLIAALVQQLRRRADRGSEEQEGNLSGAPSGLGLDQALGEEGGPALQSPEERRRTANIIGWIVGFGLVIWVLGFHVGLPLFTLLYLRLAGRERWPITLIMVAGVWASIALFFDCTVHIFFIPGELFVWLGLNPVQWNSEICRAVAAILPW